MCFFFFLLFAYPSVDINSLCLYRTVISPYLYLLGPFLCLYPITSFPGLQLFITSFLYLYIPTSYLLVLLRLLPVFIQILLLPIFIQLSLHTFFSHLLLLPVFIQMSLHTAFIQIVLLPVITTLCLHPFTASHVLLLPSTLPSLYSVLVLVPFAFGSEIRLHFSVYFSLIRTIT